MGASDKMEAGMDKLKGKAKEATGRMTDNEKLIAEGKDENEAIEGLTAFIQKEN